MASITLDWLHIVALLGAVQGVFLAVVLATRRRNRTATRLLAAAMLCFSVYLASSVYHATGQVRAYPHFFGVAYPLPFLFGPLIYLYAVTAADRTRPFTRRDALHFVPFVVTVLVGLPIYLMSGPEKVALNEQLMRGDAVPLVIRIADPLKLVSGVSYAVVTLVFLLRHRERVKESYSSTERVNLRWLLWLGGAGAGIWALALVFQVLRSADLARVTRNEDFISLAIAALVYGIGYRGLRQPEVFRYQTAEYPVPTSRNGSQAGVAAAASSPAAVPTPDIVPAAEPEEPAPRYERSGLTDRQAERLKTALLALMDEEQPWRDSGLTLADLAARLNTTPHKLSEVLNSQVGQTFYDFVNGYRVREVQRRIAAGEAQRYTMLTLALDAGFASKSTFNVVFKKYTSQTPSDFRQAIGA